MDKIYLERRTKRNYTSHRLNERIEVIISALKESMTGKINSILDVGTADGIVLNKVADFFNIKCAVGIDVSQEALTIANQQSGIKVSFGDCLSLPFKNDTFELLLASAVLEHIKEGESALKECYRVLKRNGLFCVTLPNPAYDWINSRLVKTYHLRRYGLKDIKLIMEANGFKIVKAYHFMLWPFGRLFFSGPIVKIVRLLRLDFLLFNHIAIGLKV